MHSKEGLCLIIYSAVVSQRRLKGLRWCRLGLALTWHKGWRQHFRPNKWKENCLSFDIHILISIRELKFENAFHMFGLKWCFHSKWNVNDIQDDFNAENVPIWLHHTVYVYFFFVTILTFTLKNFVCFLRPYAYAARWD